MLSVPQWVSNRENKRQSCKTSEYDGEYDGEYSMTFSHILVAEITTRYLIHLKKTEKRHT